MDKYRGTPDAKAPPADDPGGNLACHSPDPIDMTTRPCSELGRKNIGSVSEDLASADVPTAVVAVIPFMLGGDGDN